MVALTLAAASLSAPVSVAAQARKVAVVAVALDRRLDTEAAAATAMLQRLVANDARFESVDLARRAFGPAQAERAQRAEAAGALVDEALNLVDEMKDAEALEKAAQAIERSEASDLSTGMPGLLDALAAHALAQQAAGRKGETASEVSHVLAISPTYRFDPRRVTPEFAALVQQVGLKVADSPRVSLEVLSTPVPGAVYVDGSYRGATPVEVAGLAPGVHYVTVVAPGYALAQGRHVAGVGVPAEIGLSPSATRNGLDELLFALKTGVPPGSGGAAASLARWAEVDEVLVAGLSKRGEATRAVVTLYSSTGAPRASAERALPDLEAVEDLARAVLAPGAPLQLAAPVSATEVRESAPTSLRRTAGLAVGAVGAAGLVAAVVCDALGAADHSTAESLKGSTAAGARAQFDEANAGFRTKRVAAISLYVGGAAVLAAGLVLTLLPESKGTPAAQVSLVPTSDGAAFSFAGSW